MGAGCELTPPHELMMTPTAHRHLMCSCACCRTQSTLSCAGSSTLPISIRFGFNWTHCFIGSHRCQVWVSLRIALLQCLLQLLSGSVDHMLSATAPTVDLAAARAARPAGSCAYACIKSRSRLHRPSATSVGG